ncbi:hypothetical protein HDU80_009833 [Chytriomyces hyalinus]|nr:hypothetical protein HDU80_009833 [Chytriomyces hyalinus]
MRIPTHLLWTQASVLLLQQLLAMHVAAQGTSATGVPPSQTLLPSSVTAQPTDSAGPPSASTSQSDQPNPSPASSTLSTLPTITVTAGTLPSSATLPPSNITSDDPDASASIVTATVTATTDNPLDAATPNGPSCMFISSSSVCHSYSGYAINRRSSLLQMPNSPVTDASVADFDSLILRSASAGAKTLLADVCLSWDESRIRYAYNYFCDYYLQNPLIIGSSPESVRGSATDCNVILNPAQQATLPRIGSSPCRAFKSTVSNYTTYCLRPPSIFATAANIQATIEFTCTTATADPEIPSVNISEPNATEHLLCGFGRLSYDSTAALRAAYSHCLPTASTSSDPCCTWDPAIQRALKSGGVAALEKGPAYTCQLTTATGQVSCGQLIGGIFGFFMSILSVVIVWVRVWKIRGYIIKPKGGVYPSGGVDAVAEKHSVDDAGSSRQGMGTVTMNRVRNVGFQDGGSDSSAGNTARSRGESHRHSAIIALTRFDHVQGPASPVSTMNKVATLHLNRINSPQFAGVATPPPPSPRSTGFNNGQYQPSAPSPRSQSLSRAAGMTVSFRDTPPRSAATVSNVVDPVAEMLGSATPTSNAFEQFTVVRDFLGQPGSTQLEWAGAGDRVRMLQGGVGADGMMHVRNLETGVEGGVPVNILARM